MKLKTVKVTVLLVWGWTLVSLMSFACRDNKGQEAVSTELKTEIETTEAEVVEIEQTEKEIEQAAAKVDSLLNEID